MATANSNFVSAPNSNLKPHQPSGAIKVGELAQQFLSLEPQKNPARLVFYHYLKNMLPLEVEFTQDMLDGFYDRALMLNYWQTNKNQLGEVLRSDLVAIAARRAFSFDPDQVLHPNELQVINLEHPRDFQALLGKIIKKFEQAGEKVRTFTLPQEQRTHASAEELLVRLQKTGRLIIEVHSNVSILLEGEPHLVRPHCRLVYSPELDFEPQVDQILATSPMRVARFVKVGQKLKGAFVQGTSFNRTEVFDKTLNEMPELFQALKRIERFFVNPVSDPDYHAYYDTMLEELRLDKNEKIKIQQSNSQRESLPPIPR
jgi:hypothetical protein